MVLLRNYIGIRRRKRLGFILHDVGDLGCLQSKIRKSLVRMQKILSGMKMSVDHGLTMRTLW